MGGGAVTLTCGMLGVKLCTAPLKRRLDGLAVGKNSPLVVAELVAVVVGRHDVNQQDVLGFGVHPGHLDLVAREHPPEEGGAENKLSGTLSLDSWLQVQELLTCQLRTSLKELA